MTKENRSSYNNRQRKGIQGWDSAGSIISFSGLEFDAAIISDAGRINIRGRTDAALYVAMTRALHKLFIYS